MVKLDIEYFQDVLNVYSSLTNLQIFITDQHGNLVSQVLEDPNLFHVALEQEELQDTLDRWTSSFSKINGPVQYDALPGIKMIICPIQLQGDTKYFVFAGCFLENSSRLRVQSYLETTMKAPENSKYLLSLLTEYSSDEIQNKINKIKKMSDVLSEWLSAQKIIVEFNDKEKIEKRVLQIIEKGEITISELLEQFFHDHPKIDFVGYARKTGEDYFTIEECFQSGDNTLKGTIFSIGEGILGQAIATQANRFWDNINLDPRNGFFHQRGIFPKSIFCYPIIDGEEVIGLFFGGSNYFQPLEKLIRFDGKWLACYIKGIEEKTFWKRKANDNLMKMTALNEVVQVLMSVQDVKRILFIMLDMSISLFHGPFASVIIQQPLRKSFEVVSRGLTSEQINEYCQDVRNRYSNNKQNRQLVSFQPVEHITNWHARVLEIPITYQNECFGYLSIGLGNSAMKADDLSFLKSISAVGGLAIHLLELANKVEQEEQIINLLIELQKYIDPNHFKQAKRAREILKGFSEYWSSGKLNTLALKYSLYFIGYDEQFVREKINNDVLNEIISEYKLVLKGSLVLSQASLNVQLLKLVWDYLDSGENADSLLKYEAINLKLLNEFVSYLSRFNIIEREISLTNTKQVHNEPKINGDLNLSKREMEVVKLVLQGNNNREIAENLYISEHTVKNHMTNIFQKLDVNDRSKVIAKIYQTGF